MSTNSSTLANGGGGDTGPLVPKLVQKEEVVEEGVALTLTRVEFEPLVVTRLGGTLPWETKSTQLQCGETVTTNDGDHNIRLVYECVATHEQFQTLQGMRANPQAVKLVSRAYTGPVTFDELRFDRIPDANGAVIRGQGTTEQPLYEIQLQSKENSESE